jgi:N-acetylgalactosamine kinase
MATFNNQKEESVPFDTSDRDWSHFVLCAFFGVLEELNDTAPFQVSGQSISLLIHGTVPQGAGVSSSSALVVSSALDFLVLFEKLSTMPQRQFAKLCARCERWVGTEGGGMDQAISIFAQQGSGRYIQFQPTFQHKAIPLPRTASWVLCHSLEESHKRHDAATLFNKRVVEGKIGCRLLAGVLGIENPPKLLWELVRQSGNTLEELEAITNDKVPATCSKQELFELVGQSIVDGEAQLKQLALTLGITLPTGAEVLKLADSFIIRDRLVHVLSETRRVQEFVALCTDGEHSKDNPNKLGDLMNQSHVSCSKLYECSSSRVERVQQVCIQAPGALGSRMTGAGWGGCVISLVQTEQIDAFCQHVRNTYYAAFPTNETTNKVEANYMFVTKPSQGSNVFDLDSSG